MKRALIPILALLAVAGGLTLWLGRSGEPWTTSSPEARAELEAGLEARMKFYRQDAVAHFRRAIELDPDFAAAKVMLFELSFEREERARLVEELRATDPDRLSERERFLVGYALARSERDADRAERLVDAYVQAHPDDPFGLAACSDSAWSEQSWAKAEKHYRKLLHKDPNWVAAQNNLGYLAMAQGRFAEAEELFKTYKFIAPDQANPHDSLGELLTVVGRYEEARTELEEALEIKPDFCITYEHLLSLAKLQGLPEWTAGLVERAETHCAGELGNTLHCEVELWGDYFRGEWDAYFERPEDDCSQRWKRPQFMTHRLAALSGRLELARSMEEKLRGHLASEDTTWPYDEETLRAILLHMTAVRQAAEDDPAAAAENFRQADELLFYWGGGQGILKLFNRLNLAAALELAGDPVASTEVVMEVRSINPAFAEVYPQIRDDLREAARS